MPGLPGRVPEVAQGWEPSGDSWTGAAGWALPLCRDSHHAQVVRLPEGGGESGIQQAGIPLDAGCTYRARSRAPRSAPSRRCASSCATRRGAVVAAAEVDVPDGGAHRPAVRDAGLPRAAARGRRRVGRADVARDRPRRPLLRHCARERARRAVAAPGEPDAGRRARRPPRRNRRALPRAPGQVSSSTPGGCFADGYDWRAGVGPRETASPPRTRPGASGRRTTSAPTSSCAGAS